MTDSNGKKRKFLKPVEFAVASLLSVAMPVTAATVPNSDSKSNIPAAQSTPQVKHPKQKQLLVKPSDKKGNEQMAGHYSHSSHSSHSSHYSSSR